MIDKTVLKALTEEKQESSWCWNCLKRNSCDIKETVGFEEQMLKFGSRKYVNVTAKCCRYILDSKAKSKKNIFWER